MDTISGFLAPLLIIAAITLLHIVLPARYIKGYINNPDTSDKMLYRLNGLLVLAFSAAIWFSLGNYGNLPYNWLYLHRWEGLAGACLLGLIFSAIVVFNYKPVRKNILADFFLGRAENISINKGRIDLKMWLYMVGAIILELNVLSFAAHHNMTYGSEASPGILITSLLLTWFVTEYLFFERVHLYTYDIFAERVGFKLGWGCLVFYPFFYTIPLWSTVHLPDPGLSSLYYILPVIIFFTGWGLARGANMQKYHFKRDPDKRFLWIKPESITDGKNTLLVNGFWGTSRHINYLGEILMASGIALATGYPETGWPWLYPLYYVILLFTREWDDDRRCAAKYGELWTEYKKRVKYRIIPFVY